MYYHPSMLYETARDSREDAAKALFHALLRSVERQQRIQMSTLELVRQLGEMYSDSQRQLADLLNAEEPARARHDARPEVAAAAGRRQMTA